LHRIGVRTIGDVAATPADALRRAVGTAVADHLGALAAGRDPRRVEPDEVERSVSSDRTFDADLTTVREVEHELVDLAGDVGRRLRARGWVARTVGIKVRFADFRTVTRVRTLAEPVCGDSAIRAVAAELYTGLDLDRPRIRLIGVKAENLLEAASTPQQLALDLGTAVEGHGRAAAASRPAVDEVADEVRARFGSVAVTPAATLGARRDKHLPGRP
jgi:DNA polymerase-4